MPLVVALVALRQMSDKIWARGRWMGHMLGPNGINKEILFRIKPERKKERKKERKRERERDWVLTNALDSFPRDGLEEQPPLLHKPSSSLRTSTPTVLYTYLST